MVQAPSPFSGPLTGRQTGRATISGYGWVNPSTRLTFYREAWQLLVCVVCISSHRSLVCRPGGIRPSLSSFTAGLSIPAIVLMVLPASMPWPTLSLMPGMFPAPFSILLTDCFSLSWRSPPQGSHPQLSPEAQAPLLSEMSTGYFEQQCFP